MSKDPFKDTFFERLTRLPAITLWLGLAVVLGIVLNFFDIHIEQQTKEPELHTVVGIAAALEASPQNKALVRTEDEEGQVHSLSISYQELGKCQDGQPIIVLKSGPYRRLADRPCDPKVIADVE